MGLAAYGTLLQMGNGGTSETFTTIAEVTNIGGPKVSMDTIEITNHSSPDAWKEFVAGLLDMGEISLDVNFDPTEATHDLTTGLMYVLQNRLKRNFRLVFPDTGTTTWAFSAFVTGFEIGAPVDDKLSASVTLRPTGGITES